MGELWLRFAIGYNDANNFFPKYTQPIADKTSVSSPFNLKLYRYIDTDGLIELEQFNFLN